MNNPVTQALPAVYASDFAALAERIPTDGLTRSEWIITGATGMIPAWITSFLAWLDLEGDLDLRLRLVVRDPAKARARFPWLDAPGSPSPSLHILEEGRLRQKRASSAHFLLHAASPATPKACAADPGGLFGTNTLLTADLLRQADPVNLQAGLFFSSSEAYGQPEPEAPRSLYPMAKRAGEALCYHYARERALPLRIARIFHTYGPGMNLGGDDRVFAELLRNALHGEALRLKSDGTGRRAFSYIQDTVAGVLTLLLQGANGCRADIGNPNGVLQVRELAELLARIAPRAPLPVKIQPESKRHESAAPDQMPDTAVLENLGWKAMIPPEEGFRRTMKSFS